MRRPRLAVPGRRGTTLRLSSACISTIARQITTVGEAPTQKAAEIDQQRRRRSEGRRASASHGVLPLELAAAVPDQGSGG